MRKCSPVETLPWADIEGQRDSRFYVLHRADNVDFNAVFERQRETNLFFSRMLSYYGRNDLDSLSVSIFILEAARS